VVSTTGTEEHAPAPEQDDAQARRRAEMGGGSLRGRVARGTIVNAVYLVSINGLTIVQGLLVAGLLGPSQYGLWGLLAISFGTLLALGGIGLNDKYIQQDHPDQKAAFELAFTLQCMLVGLFTAIALIAIPLFAALYDEPRILVPGLLMAAAMPLIALQTPMWVFYRRMDFVKQRLLQGITPVVMFFVTVPLAVAGVGFWSLVIGTLAGSLVASTMAIYYSPYKLRFRYERGVLREYATFSWPLFVGSISLVLMFQIPITIASREIGVAAVGAIAFCSQLTQYTRRVDEIITYAMYPAICAVKDKRDLLFESFSKSNRMALLWGLPLGVAAALFAPAAVPRVLGESWEFAVPLLQILGISAALNQIGFNWTAFARARGETRVLATGAVVAMVTMIGVGVPLLLSHGLTGFGYAMLLSTLAAMAVRMAYLARLFPARRIAVHVARSFVPTVPAAAAILLERQLLGFGDSVARLVLETVAFVVLVAATTWVAERSLLREAVGYLRQRARTTEAHTEPPTLLA
jgi:O-antigen/teichoic acid export membrane protein